MDYKAHTGMDYYKAHTAMDHYKAHTAMDHYKAHTAMDHYKAQHHIHSQNKHTTSKLRQLHRDG